LPTVPPLAKTLGVSDATVLRWCEAGLLPDQPARAGSGHHRSFTDRDAAVAQGLAVVSRGLTPNLPFRTVIGPAVRDAALAGETEARIEIAPGFVLAITWASPSREEQPRC
jgi:hypothetical protein